MGALAQGFATGLKEQQDRAFQAEQLKLQKDNASAMLKAHETEGQMKQLQLHALQQKLMTQEQLPGQIAGAMGPQSAPLGPQDFGPVAQEPNRQHLASILATAQSHGVPWEDTLKLMATGDPRIKDIQDSLMPEQTVHVKDGEQVKAISGPRKGQVLAEGKDKPVKPDMQIERVVGPNGEIKFISIDKTKLSEGLPAQTEIGSFPGQGEKKSYEIKEITNPDGSKKLLRIDKTDPNAPMQELGTFAGPPPKDERFSQAYHDAVAIASQLKYGRMMSPAEYVQADPVEAEKLRVKVKVDEPTEVTAGNIKARQQEAKNTMLSPSEANLLGVPQGTTKGQAEGVMPITAVQRAALAHYDNARVIINDIKQYSDKVNTSSGGLKGKSEQAMKLWGAWTQSNPDAALLSSKAGELANVARSMGESGALATADVARAAALVPGVLDTKEVAQRKIKDMLSLIDQGESNYRKSLGLNARGSDKTSKKAPPIKEDPLAAIPVPQGYNQKQADVWRKAYAEAKEKAKQKMSEGAKQAEKNKPSFTPPKGIGKPNASKPK